MIWKENGFCPQAQPFQTDPLKGSPTNREAQNRAQAHKETPLSGEDTAAFFQTRRAGERGAGACASQHCPLLPPETEGFTGKSQTAPFQELSEET